MVFYVSCYWRLRDRNTALGDWGADHTVPNHLPKSSFLDSDADPICLRHRLAYRMGILAPEEELVRETSEMMFKRQDKAKRAVGLRCT